MSELFREVQDALAAKDREIAALEAALELEHEETKRLREIIVPTPDPTEAMRAGWSDQACRAVVEGMRAKCEEVARQATTRKKCVTAIAALKGQ